MGKVKKKVRSGLLKAAVGVVSPRAAKVLETVGGIKGKIAGRGKAQLGVKRRSRGLNINKFAKKLMKAKLDNKLMKEKMKAISFIK